MTNVRDLFSMEDFNKAVDDGFLSVKVHPTDERDILCYTPKASYTNDAFNNPAVRHSRGLIVDHSGSILARPWSKFFNCNQEGADKIDLDEPVVVMDKADGSLGVLYFNGEGYSLATKGSFTSEQSRHGTSVWNAKYEGKVEPLPGYTFLFEIVYRENKIVIDYGDMDDLVLLGAVEIDTGFYYASDKASAMLGWTGQIAKVFPYKTLREALEAPPRENAEGFVILAADHKRMVKYKYEDYLYLHRMVSNLTPRTVWERLYNKESVSDIVGSYPDEFQDEVTEYIDKIKVEFSDYIFQVALVYDSMKHIASQKDFAQEALKYPYSAELFLLRQNKDIFQTVMKRIYPPAIDKS